MQPPSIDSRTLDVLVKLLEQVFTDMSVTGQQHRYAIACRMSRAALNGVTERQRLLLTAATTDVRVEALQAKGMTPRRLRQDTYS